MTVGSESRGYQRLFIVGCPRSGTTWMQLLMAEHPAVSTTNETFLFYRYIDALVREWEAEPNRYKRPVGLKQVVDEMTFYRLCRSFADGVLSEIAGEGTELVLEKTPGHVLRGRQILACFPDAYILHVVRDPRDVVSSFLAAGQSWAGSWARSSAHDVAHLWKRSVSAGREISRMTDRTREVRYEDLKADAAGQLAEILDWTGLSHTAAFCEEAARACSIDSVRTGANRGGWDTSEEPDKFFRKGTTGGWRQELSARQIHTVEYVTRALMQDYGYETTSPLLDLPPLPEIRKRISTSLRRMITNSAS